MKDEGELLLSSLIFHPSTFFCSHSARYGVVRRFGRTTPFGTLHSIVLLFLRIRPLLIGQLQRLP